MARRRTAITGAALLLGWLSGLGPNTAGTATAGTGSVAGARPGAAIRAAAGVPAGRAGRSPDPPVARSPAGQTGRTGAVPEPPPLSIVPDPRQPASPGGSPATGSALDCRKAKCVALTFDDGPGPYTAKLLDILAAGHTRVTFFLVGGAIGGHEALVARELAEGHAIGDHTWAHPQLSTLPDGAIRSQLARALAEIRRATGAGTVLMRPPYGATNRRVGVVARRMGLAQIMWSVDTNDWRDRDARVVAHRAVSWARRGDIILMHDIHPTTVAAVPAILAGLARRGFTLVTVPELFGGESLRPGGVYFDAPAAPVGDPDPAESASVAPNGA